ncbi:hypothetical protein [Desulfonema magnum]|uniref:hypothetical protein n=1 Tax=Desulfonema magnum TaxID=45655 RepID=UPI001A9BE2B5|nr:hypothetical protein [Desulfonema magnum]
MEHLDFQDIKKLNREFFSLFNKENFILEIKKKENLKDIVFQDIKALNYTFSVFFRESPSPKIENTSSLIKKFMLIPSEIPFYERLNSPDEIKSLLNRFKKLAVTLETSVDNIAEDYERQSENSKIAEPVNMISRIIQQFLKTVKYQIERFDIKNVVTVNDIRYQFYLFLKPLLKENLIERVIPAIFIGMKNGEADDVYESLLGNINKLLFALGVHTAGIEAGQKINFEICEVISSDQNKTDDHRLSDTIKEVRQLPYIFDNNHVLVDGKVVVWRVVNG